MADGQVCGLEFDPQPPSALSAALGLATSQNLPLATADGDQILRPAGVHLRDSGRKAHGIHHAIAGGMSNDSTIKPDGNDDDHREFERKMRLFEEGPTTTNFEQLLAKGIELPPPDTIPEDQINTKLWEVIRALAEIRVFLDATDHLSDRGLYEALWHRVLHQDVPEIDGIGFNEHVDVSFAGEDWSTVHLRYYADEETRLRWAKDFPDDVIPPHEDPPYDRDRLLPSSYGDRSADKARGDE